jgi:hypothetical protein
MAKRTKRAPESENHKEASREARGQDETETAENER